MDVAAGFFLSCGRMTLIFADYKSEKSKPRFQNGFCCCPSGRPRPTAVCWVLTVAAAVTVRARALLGNGSKIKTDQFFPIILWKLIVFFKEFITKYLSLMIYLPKFVYQLNKIIYFMEIIARTRTFSREINPNSSASRSRRDKFCSKMLDVLASYLHRITNNIVLFYILMASIAFLMIIIWLAKKSCQLNNKAWSGLGLVKE